MSELAVGDLLRSFVQAQTTLDVVKSHTEGTDRPADPTLLWERLTEGTARVGRALQETVTRPVAFRDHELTAVARANIYARWAVAEARWAKMCGAGDFDVIMEGLHSTSWEDSLALRGRDLSASDAIAPVPVPWPLEEITERGKGDSREFWELLWRFVGYRMILQSTADKLFRFPTSSAAFSALGVVAHEMNSALRELRTRY
ncbi:hypothetical protein [Streptomyces sp. NPDC005438]|uniref:hypothetical protein n=1 Tax=Streptomyces sp. NPDC005438 TaxID=3156880 RepID=UPI0033A51F6A